MLEIVQKQDTETLLGLTHCMPVDPHETVYIPPGLLHAIGEGILLAEVQEPEDLSVLLEWKGYEIDGAKEGHLGVGFEEALGAVELKARSREEVEALVKGGRKVVGQVLGEESGEYFRLEVVKVEGLAEEDGDEVESGEQKVEAGFAVVLVLDGEVEIVSKDGNVLKAPAGSTVVVPYAAGELVLRGTARVLFARPPKVGGEK